MKKLKCFTYKDLKTDRKKRPLALSRKYEKFFAFQ